MQFHIILFFVFLAIIISTINPMGPSKLSNKTSYKPNTNPINTCRRCMSNHFWNFREILSSINISFKYLYVFQLVLNSNCILYYNQCHKMLNAKIGWLKINIFSKHNCNRKPLQLNGELVCLQILTPSMKTSAFSLQSTITLDICIASHNKMVLIYSFIFKIKISLNT